MEDRRIVKTRRNIKATMIALLREQPFEKITVSELCRRGETSRITFYNYYESKYALAEEMFGDYVNEAVADYRRLQAENNPEGRALGGYHNMLECILDLYANNREFFSQATPERNPYLFSAFSRHIFASVEDYIRRHTAQIRPRYTPRETAALLCGGLWGVINECYAGGYPQETVRMRVRSMYQDILTSALFQSAGAEQENK